MRLTKKVTGLVTPEQREHYFRHRSEWMSSECCDDHQNEYIRCRLANRPWVGDEASCKMRRAYDKRTPSLFKVEWSGDGFVGLCSKTYYCFGPTDKYSKGLSKRHNDIDKNAFPEVLTNRRSGSGKNRGLRVRHSPVLTYVKETSGSHLLLCQTRGVRERSEHGSGGRVEKGDALWSSFISDHGRTVETSFHVNRRRTDGMRQKYFRDAYATSRCCDDRSTPERITWCYGEWQEAYATMDLVDARFEEGLPSASMFDSSTRNLIVIDDLMAKTDERVTTLFTKKVIT